VRFPPFAAPTPRRLVVEEEEDKKGQVAPPELLVQQFPFSAMGFVSVFFHKWGFPQRDLGDTASVYVGNESKDIMAHDEKQSRSVVVMFDNHPAVPDRMGNQLASLHLVEREARC
jgi:hypothetical protein